MSRAELIQTLVNDFVSMFPEASFRECFEVRERLNGLTDEDLNLLVSQLRVAV